MARQYAVDDSDWEEVNNINGYALFMGYLMMGVRGLGLLVITWTTVVLLGGFVSDLGKKDFWCLTGITLIQIAGVFNFLLTEKLSDMVHLWWGLLGSAVGTFRKDEAKMDVEDIKDGEGRYDILRISKLEAKRVASRERRLLLAFAATVIQGFVLFVTLCPVAILYVFGLYISAGASLWRLIKQDFGNDGGANMKPALQVLYSLAVAQGALFGYKMIYAFASKTGLVKLVYNELGKQVQEALIAEYLEETLAGCEKDPSFATGRNLVSYGMDLMKEANQSNEGFIAGIKVLGGVIKGNNYCPRRRRKVVLAKYLLTTSDSSSAIIHRLLETVGPRSPYSREIKEHVVCIVDVIAGCIRLEQFPRAIECLCSVVDTSEESEQLQGKHSTDGDHQVGDYERLELLEEYEKRYVKYDLRNASPEFSLGTLREVLCRRLPWKRKNAENEGEEKIKRAFDRLLIKATNIIHKLIAHEDNRWTLRTCVSSTALHKIAMLPLKLHKDNHNCWNDYWYVDKLALRMLQQCWVITEWLLVALTETSSPPLLCAATTPVVGEGRQRSREIEEEVQEGEEQLLLLRSMDGSDLGSTIKCTIEGSIQSTIKCIFDCRHCPVTQKSRAIQILFHLSLDVSFIVKDSEISKRRLSWILLHILCSTDRDDSMYWMVPSLTYRNKNCCDFDGIRRLAGEMLSEMLREKHGATELQSIRLALEDLTSASCAHALDISTRIDAIIIMKDLCVDHTRYSEVVEEFLVCAIPEVVKETLIRCDGSITAERQQQATDVEKGNVSQDNQDDCKDNQRLREALASLCDEGYMSHHNPTLRSQFKEKASKTCKEQRTSFSHFEWLISRDSIRHYGY